MDVRFRIDLNALVGQADKRRPVAMVFIDENVDLLRNRACLAVEHESSRKRADLADKLPVELCNAGQNRTGGILQVLPFPVFARALLTVNLTGEMHQRLAVVRFGTTKTKLWTH